MGEIMEKAFENLTKLIKQSGNVILMTHKFPDFDGLSSALCLQQIINDFNIDNCIVDSIDGKSNSINKAYNMLNESNINYNVASKFHIDENTLLIILDTHKEVMVEDAELLKKVKNIVVIDHHIKSKEYIKNSLFTYINANLSSIVEFTTLYLKYLNIKVNSLLATFMLVGLEVDTNGFNLKTSSKTHTTAAVLFEMGADNVLKQIILKETLENYRKRHRVIEKSVMINTNYALCVANDEVYSKVDLATIAEELLQFEDVEASFAIGRISDEEVGISARSIGNVNVEKIMAQLNGGGHMTEAATQIKVSIKEAERFLRRIIGG